jgi:WD40 repeat protein
MLTLLLGVCVSAGLTFWALGERDRADDAYKKSVEAAKNEEQQRKVAERELYHSLLSRVREAAITAQPGWTWRSLDDLAKARKLNVADEDPVEPRSLAAEVLSRFDLRETGVLAEGLDVEALTFSSDGKLLATAEKRNAFECLIKVWNFNDGTLHNTFRYSTLGSSWTSVLKGEAGKHDGLKCIAISPDGKWLVVGTRYGKLARWDTTVEKPKPVIWSGHGDNQMRSLAFSPDGNLLLSVSGNKIMTWDVSKNWKGTPLRDGKDGGVHAAFTADGKSLAIADNPILLSRDHVLDLQPLGPDTPSRRAVAFSPDGRTLAAPHGNDIELWDVETRRAARILRSPIAPEGKNVFCIGLNFSVDGSVLAATYDNSIVHFWDVAAAKLLHTMRVADRDEPTVRFCPDGRRFVVAADRRTKVFEMRPLDVRTTVAHEPFAIQDMVLSDDGATIRTLTKTSEQVEECRLAEWRTASGKLLGSERFAGLIGGQRETLFRRASLAMDRNHLLVSASAGVGSLVIPLAASGPAPRVTFPHAKRFFEVTPKEMQLRGDGVSVAANDQARAGEAVRIPASVADAGVRLRVPVAAHKANGRRCLIIAAVRVERKGDVPPTMQFTLLSAEKGRQWKSDVKLAPASTPGFQAYLCDGIDLKNAPQDEWFEIDFRVGKTDSKDIVWLESFSFLVTTAPNDVFRQGNFAFSSDGRRLWGVVNNDNVTSWHAPDFCAASVWHDSFGENLLGPSPILRLAVGTQWVLAGNDRGDIFRLSASTGEKETSWPGPGGAVRGLALHPAGDLAAVGTQKGKLRLLRIPAGETLADLPPHTQSVEAILFSKDGNLLVTGSLDQTIRVWHKRGSKYEVALTLKCAAGLSALHLSADNQTLAVLSDTERAVRVWHLDKLKTQLDGQGFGW